MLRKFVTLPESVYKHLSFEGIFTVDVAKNAQFNIRHYGYIIENELFWKGIDGWEAVSFRIWIELCKNSKVIMDLGANTGVYSLIANAVAPNSVIIAVEPLERIFKKLNANVALNNGGVHTYCAVVSDHTGTATLYDLPHSEHILSVSVEPSWNSSSQMLVPIEVASYTVTDLLKEHDLASVDLLKIDVETHEPAVLRGFKDIITRDRPTMLIEILNESVAAEVLDLISGLDYIYFNLDEITWPPPRVKTLSKSKHFNFLICRPEVAIKLGI